MSSTQLTTNLLPRYSRSSGPHLLGNGLDESGKPRPAQGVTQGKVGATHERLQLWSEEDIHRPTSPSLRRLEGGREGGSEGRGGGSEGRKGKWCREKEMKDRVNATQCN